MKKRFILLSLAGVLGSYGFSSGLDVKQVEEFAYKKGYSDGYKDGKNIGFSKGMENAKKILAKYKASIDAMEKGKYLSIKGKITPPRLYQVKNPDGSYRVVVRGCEIRKQLTPEEILSLPVDTDSEENTLNRLNKMKNSTEDYSDSVGLLGVDNKSDRDQKDIGELSGKAVLGTYRIFPNTAFYRKLFEETNKVFTIANDKIKVLFSSDKEANLFFAKFNLSEGEDGI